MTRRTIRADRPVDPITVELLRAVAETSLAERIDYMLVGATARDILLSHVFGLPTRRATHDVDFAIAVADWRQFDALKARLVARRTFQMEDAARQRLYYRSEGGSRDFHVDLVPFGDIAQGTHEVAWPPDLKVVMNIAGYDDAIACAEMVSVAPEFDVRVVSLAGLAILKLVAWSDRGRVNPKDAHDLIQLMNSYAVAGNFDRVYAEDGVIDAGHYDPDMAGVYLLGKDIQRVASPHTLDTLRKIIQGDFNRLVHEMIKSLRHLDNVEEQVSSRLRLLQQGLG